MRAPGAPRRIAGAPAGADRDCAAGGAGSLVVSMDEQSRHEHLSSLIESIATRSDSASRRLGRALLQRSWPGGAGDRTEPGALAWLRLWGPRGRPPLPPACSCPEGRCAVCN